MASNTDLPRPFTVEYDPDLEEYFIFAPEGCVLVNGEAAEIVDAESGNVTLGIDPDDLPDYLYAHVSKNDDGEYEYKVEFDGEETKDGAKWNIRVVRFGADENDGNQYDILASAINLGSSAAPEPFDIFTDDDGTKVKASEFWFNGTLQEVTDDLTIAGKGEETVYLVCKKDESGSEGSTGWTFELSLTEDGAETSLNVKLYDFKDGKVTMDYRGANLPVNPKSSNVTVYPKPFDIDGESVIGGSFYFNGTLKDVPESIAFPEDGSVYLVGSKSSDDYNFSLSTAPSTEEDGISIKLYDFEGGKVTLDLRDTFLTFTKPSDATVSFKDDDKEETEAYDSFTLNQTEDKVLVIPRAKDGVLTLKYGDTEKTFSANQEEDEAFEVPVVEAPVSSVDGSTERASYSSGKDIVPDSTTGAVVLKVNKAKVATLSDAQTITGAKTFTSIVTVDTTRTSSTTAKTLVRGGALDLYLTTPYIDFHYNNSTEDFTERIYSSSSGLEIRAASNGGGNVRLIGADANKVILYKSPTTTLADFTTSSKEVLDGGWAASNRKSLKVNGSEVAKVIGTADVDISTSGSSSINLTNQVVITSVSWDSTNHKIVMDGAKMTVTNGLITGWTALTDTEKSNMAISTVAHSTVVSGD